MKRMKLEQRVDGAELDIRTTEDGRLTIEGDPAVVLELAAALFTSAWVLAWQAGIQEAVAVVQRARDAAGGMPELDATEPRREEPHYDA